MNELFTKKIPEFFYSYLPSWRKEYSKAHALNALFAKIEKIPLPPRTSLIDRTQLIEGKTIDKWLELGIKRLDRWRSKNLFKHEKAEWDRFEEQLVGLQYRSGALAKGTNYGTGLSLFAQFEPIVSKQMASPCLFPGRLVPIQLTAQERDQLEHACIAYPVLIEKLIERSKNKNDPWVSSFIKWVLRSGCNIGVFVKTPIEKKLLSAAHLDKRSGAVDGKKGIHFHNIDREGVIHRVVSLKIDGAMQPIQGDYKKEIVVLKNIVDPSQAGIRISIEKIFNSFKEKTHKYGDIEYLKNGISNWNTIKLASFNGFTKQYTHLKPDEPLLNQLLERVSFSLTEEQMQSRYINPQPLNDGQWGLAVKASRLKPNLNMLETHGYLELVRRRGTLYDVLPLGVQPLDLPSNTLQRFLILAASKPAQVHATDESYFTSNRQHTGIFFPLSDAETERLHRSIEKTYKLGQTGELVFQFGGDNCAFHIQKIFDEVIGAPFYEKMESIIQKHLTSRNIISRLLIRDDSVRAFQGLNHKMLKPMFTYIVDDLSHKGDVTTLQELNDRGVELLNKICNENLRPICLQREDLSQEAKKKMIVKLLFQTVEMARFYRMDLFRSHTDQPFLKIVNKVIEFAPWRWLKTAIVRGVLFLMGSWRWVISRKPEVRGQGWLPLKNLASNPLVREGFLNHPAALSEEWLPLQPVRLEKIKKYIESLR